MKRLMTLFLCFFLASSVLTVQAQAIPTPTHPPLPGTQNCGYINAPDNACCHSQPINFANINPQGSNIVADAWQGIINQIINPIFAPAQEIVQQATPPCIEGAPTTPGDLTNPSCFCVVPTPPPLTSLKKFCAGLPAGEQASCETCNDGSGVWTGAGCIYTDVRSFIEKTVFGWGIGLAGMISLLCIIYASFSMITSRGNAEAIKKAQELLTSCIMGLLLIIFSVFILRAIGVSILQIPGFQ